MLKSLENKKIKILLFFFIGIVSIIVYYQISIYQKYKGNFLLHVEYSGGLNNNCVDLLVKVNGKDIYKVDSLGWCNNKYSVDTILNLPLGINTIELSSPKLNLFYDDRIYNLFYMYASVEIVEHYGFNHTDSLKKISVRYGYGRLELM